MFIVKQGKVLSKLKKKRINFPWCLLQGLFRRVIYSHLKPAELVQINSQLLGSERWSQWPPGKQSSNDNLGASVAVCKSVPAVSTASTAANKVSLVKHNRFDVLEHRYQSYQFLMHCYCCRAVCVGT